MIDLSGKVAVVTGGSRGIGLAVSARLVSCGAKVGVLARDLGRAEEAAQALGASDRVVGASVDVADSSQVGEAIDAIEGQLGPVDILVNNAGIAKDGVLVRMSEEAWDSVLNTNLKGAFNTIRHLTRGMMKRRSGRIVNIASVVGLTGNRGQANYSASKAGLIGFTKAVAKELASRNILVNAVAPGFIDTDMTRELPDAARETLLQQIPLARLGSGDEVANVVAFLVSELASYITGQVIVVDGGMVM